MPHRRIAPSFLLRELAQYKEIVAAEIQRIIATKRFRPALRDLLLDYPLREGKGLRPSLCLATCQACGGRLADALTSAAALELFHNAFLIHDDIEDESLYRRGDGTLVQKHGTAIAINVGDTLSVLSVSCLLENTGIVGLEKSLRIFHEIERMAREAVDGQALELDWVKHACWRVRERDYFLMTYKKTCWYTCIAPCRIGAIVAGSTGTSLNDLKRFGYFMGIAFQIQDDILNLSGDESYYGKERAGDIWEGKRTLMLIHVLKHAIPSDAERIMATLSLPRTEKTQDQVDDILTLMEQHGSLEYSRQISRNFATKARSIIDRQMTWMEESPYKRFLCEIVDYAITRDI